MLISTDCWKVEKRRKRKASGNVTIFFQCHHISRLRADEQHWNRNGFCNTNTHTMCSLLSVFTIGHRLTIDFTIGRTLHTHSHSPSSNSSSTLAKLLLGWAVKQTLSDKRQTHTQQWLLVNISMAHRLMDAAKDDEQQSAAVVSECACFGGNR